MDEERRRRVNELFLSALEREPETRLAFLDSACGEDTNLRHQVGTGYQKVSTVNLFSVARECRSQITCSE